MHAVNKAYWDGERGKGTSFGAASGTKVEGPIGTLEVLCWSEADSGFCAGLCGVAWNGFFVFLGVFT